MEMQYFKKLTFNATLITLLICAIITAVNFVGMPDFDLSKFVFSRSMLKGFLVGFFLYIGNSLTFAVIRKILPNDVFYAKRVLLFLPFTAILTIVVVFSVNLIDYLINGNESFEDFLSSQSYAGYFNMVILSILVSFLIFGFYFYKIYKERQLNEQTQIAGQATAALETLKNQIDPHFLFNSLNVLTGLIEENQDKAVDYTNSLSRIYRYVLEQKDKETTTIAQEIDFAKHYILLLKLRFEEAIQCDIEVSNATIQAKTVPLALQLLLENCIQHNIATEENILKIRILSDANHLIVQNNLQEKVSRAVSTKVGLNNIRERYKLISNKAVEVIKDDEYYTVKLPLL